MIILWIAYCITAVFMFFIITPRIVWSLKPHWRDCPNSDNKFFGFIAGLFASILWIPFLVGLVVAKIVFSLTAVKNFWDEPAPLRGPVARWNDRRAAVLDAQRESVLRYREAINDKEAELGFPLTNWVD